MRKLNQNMKNLFFSAAIVASTFFFAKSQPILTPQPSTTQTIKQNFGLGSVELSYSRPNVKNRKVFGDLVPLGKIWRTGANSATTLLFSDDVTIGGTEIKAGKYGLLSMPDATEWTMIITKDLNVNQPALYKPENDVVRIKVKSMNMANPVETFTMQFANVTNSSCDLQLMWQNTAVALPITTGSDAKVMTQINNTMNNDNKPYFGAAQYYYENGKDMAKAKEWVDKALGMDENKDAFYMYLLKARISEKLGDRTAAKSAATKTIELATKAKNDDYVKMASDLLKRL